MERRTHRSQRANPAVVDPVLAGDTQHVLLSPAIGVDPTGTGMFTLPGDARNLVTEPVNVLGPMSGQTHSQRDVFFQQVKAQ